MSKGDGELCEANKLLKIQREESQLWFVPLTSWAVRSVKDLLGKREKLSIYYKYRSLYEWERQRRTKGERDTHGLTAYFIFSL